MKMELKVTVTLDPTILKTKDERQAFLSTAIHSVDDGLQALFAGVAETVMVTGEFDLSKKDEKNGQN